MRTKCYRSSKGWPHAGTLCPRHSTLPQTPPNPAAPGRLHRQRASCETGSLRASRAGGPTAVATHRDPLPAAAGAGGGGVAPHAARERRDGARRHAAMAAPRGEQSSTRHSLALEPPRSCLGDSVAQARRFALLINKIDSL